MEKRVEYLCIFDNKDNTCRSDESFLSLLKTNDMITIKYKKIHYEDLSIKYKLQMEEIEEINQRYFHLTLLFDNEDKLDIIEKLLRDIRTVVHKFSDRTPIVIWDDISYDYAIKSYPIIYRLENLMRKLITKFMTAKLGLPWPIKAILKK